MYTYSLSAFKVLTSITRTKNSIVIEPEKKVCFTFYNNMDINFCWISSRVGIEGNEEPNKLPLVKSSLREWESARHRERFY